MHFLSVLPHFLVIPADVSPCVSALMCGACKLRTALEATRLCGRLCVYRQHALLKQERSEKDEMKDDSGEYAYEHTSGEVCRKRRATQVIHATGKSNPNKVYLLAGEGVLYPLRGSPGKAGGDKLPSMWGKK